MSNDDGQRAAGKPARSLDQENLEIDQRKVDNEPNINPSDLRLDVAELFTQATEQTRMALCVSDPRQDDCPIVYVNEAFVLLTGYERDEVVGRNCRFLQGPETDPTAVETIRKALDEREVRVVDVLNYRKDGTPFWNALHVGPMFDDAGELQYFYGSQWDVTEIFEKREQILMQDNVAKELQHRTGNLFAIINAIVNLSARGAGDVADYRDTLNQRLGALGKAHALSVGVGGAGEGPSDLRQLVTDIVEPYRDGHADRIRLAGDAVALPRNAATPIGLTLHELATNAIKYGALSSPDGEVCIDWDIEDAHLVIKWVESGGPPVEAPIESASQGTGHRIMQGTLHQLGGSLEHDWRTDGLAATIRIPHE